MAKFPPGCSDSFFQPSQVKPRLSSWPDPFSLPSVTWFVGGPHEPSLLKTSPRIHLKVPGGSRGTRAEVQQTNTSADIYYTNSSLHPSMSNIFCQRYIHQGCHQKNATQKWERLSSSRTSSWNCVLHWVFVSSFH